MTQRIIGALLVGLALCPLVPLLGRAAWPAWVGPFLGALFGVAMFRTKPAVKIAAALALGFGFNLFRAFTSLGIVDLTRWSLPIGFFAGWAVYVALALLNRRARVIAAVVGVLLIAGIVAYQYGIFALLQDRYEKYVAEWRWQMLLRSKTVSLPKVDRVEIAVGVPQTHGVGGGWKPGIPVVLTGDEAEQFAAIWRSRRFLDGERPYYYYEMPIRWYLKFSAQGNLLLQTEIKSPPLLFVPRDVARAPSQEGYVVIDDSGDVLQASLSQTAPFPAVTRSVFECQDGTAKCSSQDFNGAIESFEKALRLDPENGDAYAGMARAYMGLDQNDRALQALTSAIKLQPQGSPDVALLQERGEMHLLFGMYRQAVDDLTRVIQTPYQKWRALDLRGQAYLRLGWADEALADFSEALAEMPDCWDFKFHKAEAERMQGAKAAAATAK